MSLRHRFADSVINLLGLDVEFDIDMRRKAFSAITDVLFVGRRPVPEDLPALAQLGITHVVSCLPESERESMTFLAETFATLFVPLHDGMHEDISVHLPKVLDFAADATSHNNPKVLVHCQVGVSRSATMAIAIMMTQQKGTFFETYTEARRKRPEILPNIGFASALQQLEFDLLGRRRRESELAAEPSSLAKYLKHICNAPVDIETLQSSLERNDYDAERALRSIFDDEIPRVMQGVRV